MSERTGIEWTDATWNPIRARRLVRPDAETLTADGERLGWHCEHVSEGCRNCYAEAMNRRLGTGLDYKPGLAWRPGDAASPLAISLCFSLATGSNIGKRNCSKCSGSILVKASSFEMSFSFTMSYAILSAARPVLFPLRV